MTAAQRWCDKTKQHRTGKRQRETQLKFQPPARPAALPPSINTSQPAHVQPLDQQPEDDYPTPRPSPCSQTDPNSPFMLRSHNTIHTIAHPYSPSSRQQQEPKPTRRVRHTIPTRHINTQREKQIANLNMKQIRCWRMKTNRQGRAWKRHNFDRRKEFSQSPVGWSS